MYVLANIGFDTGGTDTIRRTSSCETFCLRSTAVGYSQLTVAGSVLQVDLLEHICTRGHVEQSKEQVCAVAFSELRTSSVKREYYFLWNLS